VLVLEPSAAEPPRAETLAAYCAQQLAGFKVPRFWEFRASLPLTASQRVEKAALGPATGPVHDTRPGRT
jgi:acyl-CoA synthetase (AMP-forming)/AMP-acid ligase II